MTDIDQLLAENKPAPKGSNKLLKKLGKVVMATGVVSAGLGFVFGPQIVDNLQQEQKNNKTIELNNNRAQAWEDGATITYNANTGKSDTSYSVSVGEYINGTHQATHKGPARDTIRVGDTTVEIHVQNDKHTAVLNLFKASESKIVDKNAPSAPVQHVASSTPGQTNSM